VSDDRPRDAGYDDFLDALEAGEPFYLEGPNGDGWLPPREIDPVTGRQELVERPLPSSGELLTVTHTQVPPPELHDDVPYTTGIAAFGPVRITGQVRGIDSDDVEIGTTVEASVGRTRTTGERVVVFEPE
jgi:uncharacterized OB-fold protein